MPLLCVDRAKMKGHVPHHAGHIIGHDSDGNPIPCNGHNVTGYVDEPGQSKLWVQGEEAFVRPGHGPSTDECDGSDFYPASWSSSMFVGGKPVVRVGDDVALHPGDGKMITANQSKFHVSR